MKKIQLGFVLGLSILAIAGCAKKNAGVNNGSSDGATTSSVSDNYQYDATGRRINSLKAPSNQTYYFDFNASSMRSEDVRALNIQANYLASHPNVKIRLEGNTDNRGSREYNIGLGWRRDQAVAQMLEQQGVRPGQIKMVSYGKERPVALGDNEKSWALNRRVDLKYIG